ncbi:uncharacterized protein LOC128236748 [Mya arenaria]|uniref:uncharacterized protein LOC128236730 n=1 Tax=Mya arenaria TaxID=6604 RepID=UPI0022E79677|nr:uncharacterized protein LOC128236730 [Mya arenaria]XP_052807759.1 uncharacterized protein LOC128236730 [Mya arenaria]XP_052807760.1 uncharacterized protein LOC128236730 [Mya arenaria]XP_052807761.1 uncharacterized protein LOC128236730 [Mya arenaria]XP_052807762.1 uncharacterized protein LOC128236730 [Mya arenaria]XP_052807763.1 uncharacterized protein LOC128236730 [Mya arenaria]XP_052807764.1 uncharacterized protein LOC128236730 [Mya arenaria]XP_052807799.1 uncharacterized protein LOC1282
MEKGQGENPPPYDEQQAQNSQNQPQVQYVQPQNSQGQPQYGQGQPQYGHGQPQYGHGQPQYGTGQPQYGHGQPQYGPGPGHQGQHFGPPPPGQVVYIQQPVHGAHPSTGEQNMANARERGRTYGHGGWSNHLCGCFNNIHLALSALIVPCATYGQTAEHAGECNCILATMAFFVPIYNLILWAQVRGKIRELKGIPGTNVSDWLTIIFCSYCALVQEAQEVQPMAAPAAISMSRQ